MSLKKNALGRGLGALLEDQGTDITTRSAGHGALAGAVSNIPMDQIEANPFQPRNHFDQEALDELASSIRTHGIIQPVTVRKVGYDRYQLISGERRFRASQLVGLTEVPAYVRVANDQSMLEMALVENIQRQDLDAIEVALSYQRLIDECNLTQEELAEKVGKSRSAVTNFLRLLKLPAEIQKGIIDRRLSMGHARALVSISDPAQQIDLFKRIIKEELSVRDVEDAVKVKAPPPRRERGLPTEMPIEVQRIEQQVADHLGTRVSLRTKASGRGALTINFKNTEDMRRLLAMLDLWP